MPRSSSKLWPPSRAPRSVRSATWSHLLILSSPVRKDGTPEVGEHDAVAPVTHDNVCTSFNVSGTSRIPEKFASQACAGTLLANVQPGPTRPHGSGHAGQITQVRSRGSDHAGN